MNFTTTHLRQMMLSSIILALLSTQSHAICEVVDPNSIAPPSDSEAIISIFATGDRIWQCNNGTLINPSQVSGTAEGEGDSGYTGGFYYVDDVATFYFNSTAGDDYIEMLLLQPTFANTTTENKLSDGRWMTSWVDPPMGIEGFGYLTRTNTTGGATPTECANVEDEEIKVPFTATYTLYVCDEEDIPINGGSALVLRSSMKIVVGIVMMMMVVVGI